MNGDNTLQYIVVCTYHTNLNIDLEEASFGLTLPAASNSLALTFPLFKYHDQIVIYVCTINKCYNKCKIRININYVQRCQKINRHHHVQPYVHYHIIIIIHSHHSKLFTCFCCYF